MRNEKSLGMTNRDLKIIFSASKLHVLHEISEKDLSAMKSLLFNLLITLHINYIQEGDIVLEKWNRHVFEKNKNR